MSDLANDKRLIGLYGEMCLALKLHILGWQVFRAYIDEYIDFVLCKHYCANCGRFSMPEARSKPNSNSTFPTDLCGVCLSPLIYIVRFVQVKTSRGIDAENGIRDYSFHAKLRSNIDPRAFYAWVALVDSESSNTNSASTANPILPDANFYIFNHVDIARFDDLSLDSYQNTDNQKTTLRIDCNRAVVNRGRKYDFSCFNDEFRDNFDAFDGILPDIDLPQRI